MQETQNLVSIVTTSPKKTWSASEEKKFLEAIDKLMISGLWGELKSDDEVAKRGANGVRSHWDALVSALSSDGERLLMG